MKKTNFKSLMGAALAMTLLAGCASNDERDDVSFQDANYGGGETADSSGLYLEQEEVGGSNAAGSDANADIATVYYFEFDSSTLNAESRDALDAQAARLKDTVGTIRLEGHADERGTREYNVALGERRAVAVADYLVLNGIPRYRIETISYGEERPIAFGQDEESWALNRRVELK